LNFASFQFPEKLLKNIDAMGYTAPTPIQAAALPAVLAGRDVMGLAQTGTGKTAAFVLPILTALMNTPAKGPGPRALIVAPTRELAEQIHQAVRALGQGIRFRSAVVYGGVGLFPQTRALRQGVDIVVACPGRLLDHMGQGNVRFPNLEVLVLDEADHMFDMGFLPDIRRILRELPARRQTLLFSATMPESIRGLANDILTDPEVVNVGHQSPPSVVSHAVYPVDPSAKTPLLLALLDQAAKSSVIVFTRTKHRAKNLAQSLCAKGLKAACIQGNLSQNRRQEAMDGFRQGRYQILVATDIAARGIDVSQVGHVINYDIPDTPEAYIHRIGRTGRAEREGQAHTLITHEDRSMVRAIESRLGKRLDRQTVPGIDAPDLDRAPAMGYAQDADGARGRDGRRPYGGRPSGGRPQGGRPYGGRSGDRPQAARSGRPDGRPDGRPEGRPEGRTDDRTGNRTDDRAGNRTDSRGDSLAGNRTGGRSEHRSEPRGDHRAEPREHRAAPRAEGQGERAPRRRPGSGQGNRPEGQRPARAFLD
jgi:ATP-dependent RNA helicase RhlE